MLGVMYFQTWRIDVMYNIGTRGLGCHGQEYLQSNSKTCHPIIFSVMQIN